MLAALLLALAAAAPVPPPADHVVNPDFDTGTDPWRFMIDRGAGGILDWDAAAGAPTAGSARVGNIYIGARYDAWEQCITLGEGPFSVQVAVASLLKAGNQCELRVVVVDRVDCSEGSGILVDLKATNTLNTGAFETIGVAGDAPANSGAVALFLAHKRAQNAAPGDSYCRYDHVQAVGNTVFANAFE